MKTLIVTIALVLTAAMPALSDPEGGVSFDLFYNSLTPYGNWISVEGGVYAWQPADVDQGWKPYYDGRWVWTDDGWYWDSDEPWAWATYHYGRWYDDDYYGWVWVPGYDWSPAWVEWRFGDGAMGWAPLGPYALFSFGWGVHYTRPWVTPVSYWTFVDCRYAAMPIRRYAYRGDDNSRWFGRTRGAGSVGTDGRRVFTRGPEPGSVERAGNVRLERAAIREVPDRPSADRLVRGSDGRDQIQVYRPRFDPNSARNDAARPPSVREGGRPLSLDARNTDALRRNVAREQGRDLQRAEEYRSRRAEPAPGYNRDGGRTGENDIQRTPDARARQSERKAIEERAPRAPQRDFNRIPDRRAEPIDRPPRIDQMQRTNPPERTLRRPESNPNAGAGSRGAAPPPSSPRPSDGGNRGGEGHRGGNRR